MLTFKLPHALDLASIVKIMCTVSVCLLTLGCDKNTTKDDVVEDVTAQSNIQADVGELAAKSDDGVKTQAPDDDDPFYIPPIVDSPATLEVIFLPSGTDPMKLQDLAEAMPKVSPEDLTPQQRKLATSVNNLWKRALAEEGRLLMFNMKESVTFEISDELESTPMETKTLKPEKNQELVLSTCYNLFPSNSALCVDECCHFSLLDGYASSMHTQLMLGMACFDLSDDKSDSYPLVKISVDVDQCDAGIIEEINP